MFIKNKPITRIASLFLTLAMLFTSINLTPLITHATDGVQGENSGGGKGDMGNYAGDYRGWNKTMGGYRFYIINSNLERVSPVYDFYFDDPTRHNIGEVIKSTRFDTSSSPNEHKLESMAFLANLAGTDLSIIPYPVTASAGQGEQFRNWFLYGTPFSNPGDPFSPDFPSGGGGGTIISGGGHTPNQNLPANTTPNPVTNYTGIDGIYSSNGTPLSQEHLLHVSLGNYLVYENSTTSTANLSNSSKNVANKLNCNNMQDYFKSELDHARNTLKMTVRDAEYYATYRVYRRVLDIKDGNESYPAVQGQLKNINASVARYIAYQMYVKYKNQTASLNYQPTDNLLVTNTLLTQQIPLAGEIDQPAVKFLQEIGGIQVPGYPTAMEAIKDNHFLVVEPITWICVPTGSNYPQARTYGSYYNIANRWVDKGGPDERSFYTTYMTKLGNNCLTVNNTITTESGKTLLPAEIKQRSVSQSVMEMEVTGLSMHIYSANIFDGTSTYDESLSTPGKAPDDSSKLTQTDQTNPQKYANIVKFYEDKLTNPTQTKRDSYTRTPSPKEITIEHESGPKYKVKEWFISTQFKSATGSTPVYSQYKSSLPNTRTGTTTTTVTLTDTETTLYVLLEKSDGNKGSGSEDTPYTLTESQISKLATADNPAEGVELSTQSFTINHQQLDNEHKITKPCDCPGPGSCNHGWYEYCGKEHKCPVKGTGCTGTAKNHCPMYHVCGNNCGEWKCNYNHTTLETHTLTLNDKITALKLAQTKTYSSLIADSVFTKNSLSPDPRTKTTPYTDTLQGYEYKFIIQRGTDDKLNLYSGVTNPKTNLTTPSSLYNFTASKAQKSSRADNDTIKYPITFEFKTDDAGSDLSTSTRCSTCGSNCGHNHSKDANATGSYTPNTNIKIQTYAGLLNSTVVDTKVNTNTIMTLSPFDGRPQATGGKSYPASGVMTQANSTISFRPYIRMTYQTLTNPNPINVNVLGKYIRAIHPNNYAEVSWRETNTYNINVVSQQWSVHEGATGTQAQLNGIQLKPWQGKNQVLPGGAMYSLNTKDLNQKVYVTTYQTVLIGEGLTQADYLTQDLTEFDDASTTLKHDQFVSSVVDTLEKTYLVQYVSTDPKEENAWESGIPVYRGADIAKLSNGSIDGKASTDPKYYFNEDSNGYELNTNESDLDVTESGGAIEYYTFYSDTEGNIWMQKLDANQAKQGSAEKILTKSQTTLAEGSTAYKINERTYVVDKLVASIERNTGNDTNASWTIDPNTNKPDGKWYNEAFNGITVKVQTTVLSVGLTTPNSRSTILDPKLIPQLDSKGELFTSAFLTQYKTSNKLIDKPTNYIGQFDGKDVYADKLDTLFYSRKFYIPNATVQDLSY